MTTTSRVDLEKGLRIDENEQLLEEWEQESADEEASAGDSREGGIDNPDDGTEYVAGY